MCVSGTAPIAATNRATADGAAAHRSIATDGAASRPATDFAATISSATRSTIRAALF